MTSFFLDDRIEKDGLGDKTAMVAPSGTWTFSQVRDGAQRLACGLQRLGLEMEQRVLLLQANTPEFVIAYWATHYVGG